MNNYTKTPQALLDHILWVHEDSPFKGLTNSEKVFYFSLCSLSHFNKGVGEGRSASFSAETWAKKLIYSKSKIFALQKSMEEKGYIKILRQKDKRGKSFRNVITPTLPDGNFNYLNKIAKDSYGHHDPFESTKESYLDYLDRVKMFILLDYSFVKKILSSKDLPDLAKLILIWLASKAYINKSNNVTFSSKEIISKFSSTSSSICRAIKTLIAAGYLSKEKVLAKNIDSNRYDKVLWNFSILEESAIKSLKANAHQETKSDIAAADPSIAQISQYNNKNTIKNNNIKNNLKKIFNSKKSFSKLLSISKEKLGEQLKTKAEKYAYSVWNKLDRQKRKEINPHRLASEFVYQAANWKPKSMIGLSDKQGSEIALSVAYGLALQGNWQTPHKLQAAEQLDKAEILVEDHRLEQTLEEFVQLQWQQKQAKELDIPESYKEILGTSRKGEGGKLNNMIDYLLGLEFTYRQILIMMQQHSPQNMANSLSLLKFQAYDRNLNQKTQKKMFLQHLGSERSEQDLRDYLIPIFENNPEKLDELVYA